jgi:hypothetical protein
VSALAARIAFVARTRRAQAITFWVALAVVAGAIWIVPARAEIIASSGQGSLTVEQHGMTGAITLSALVPGQSGSATFTLRNAGVANEPIGVRRSDLTSTPGIGGGDLARQLDVEIVDVDAPASSLWSGKLADLDEAGLGLLPSGTPRSFRVSVGLPDGGEPPSALTGDNATMAARVTFSLSWGLGIVSQAARPAASGLPSAPPPTRGRDQAQVLGATARRVCVSRRLFEIRLRVPRRAQPVARAEVFVGNKRVAVVRGTRWRSRVDLRRLPAGRFTVRIVLTRKGGRHFTERRDYRTCVPRGRR